MSLSALKNDKLFEIESETINKVYYHFQQHSQPFSLNKVADSKDFHLNASFQF